MDKYGEGKWVYFRGEGCSLIAGSPPWGPPAGGKGTAGWPGPPEELDCCPRPLPRSSARLGQRPSGRSPGYRDSGGTLSCPDLDRKTKHINVLAQFQPDITLLI